MCLLHNHPSPGWSICDHLRLWRWLPPGVHPVHLQPHPHLPAPTRAPHVRAQHGGEEERTRKGGSGQVEGATGVPVWVEEVRRMPHLLPAHARQQAQVREVVQGGSDRHDHLRPNLLPAGICPRVPGVAGRTPIIACNWLAALGGSEQSCGQADSSIRARLPHQQARLHSEVHVLQPGGRGLVQASGAEDEDRKTRTYQGWFGHTRAHEVHLRWTGISSRLIVGFPN